MTRYNCPCCGYPTLEERQSWEICCLCDWEDDGQDDPYADQVWGGPNQDYSLTQARQNFRNHYSMYEYKQIILTQTDKEIQTKKSLIHAFKQLEASDDQSAPYIWQEIYSFEKILADLVDERVERYSNNIDQNRESMNLINSDNPDAIVDGLLSLALSADDGEFAEQVMTRYSQHDNENIRGIAILCFGHIARIHEVIHKEQVISLIQTALHDESSFVRGHAESALEDINMFCK